VFPYWVITLNTFLVAFMPALVGAWTAVKTWSQTKQLFSINPLLVAVGTAGILAMAMALHEFSKRNVDSRFYYWGLDAGAYGSLIFTAFASAVFGLSVLGFGVIYCSGIAPEGSGKYDRRPDEPDPLGQMITERMRDRSASA
jgi:hypothetical protein